VVAWPLTGGPHMSANFKYQKNLKISSLTRKIRYKVRKNLGKLMEVGNPIWNTFQYCNFFQIFTDFELFQRFRVKSSLTELWSISLVATAIETSPELKCGQGVLHAHGGVVVASIILGNRKCEFCNIDKWNVIRARIKDSP
jgi:hypothetical protein